MLTTGLFQSQGKLWWLSEETERIQVGGVKRVFGVFGDSTALVVGIVYVLPISEAKALKSHNTEHL